MQEEKTGLASSTQQSLSALTIAAFLAGSRALGWGTPPSRLSLVRVILISYSSKEIRSLHCGDNHVLLWNPKPTPIPFLLLPVWNAKSCLQP